MMVFVERYAEALPFYQKHGTEREGGEERGDREQGRPIQQGSLKKNRRVRGKPDRTESPNQ
eukprot:11697217-Prorocentrum_lima.AAC.1